MRILSLEELQAVIDRNPEVRVHMIPLDTGLVVDEKVLLVADPEGWIRGIDLDGLENVLVN